VSASSLHRRGAPFGQDRPRACRVSLAAPGREARGETAPDPRPGARLLSRFATLLGSAFAVVLVVVLATRTGSAPGAGSASGAVAQVGVDARAGALPFAVGLRVVRLIDRTRTIRLPDRRVEPRALLTYVRYPALGPSSGGDRAAAPAARPGGPFPLIVFGHGFAVTPALYSRLLRAWTRAGYVVAAPVFPLENANAPGGPDEADLVNQPADMRFVITRLLAASARPGTPFSGLIDPARVAVAGHSDGGETALAVAYDRGFRDSRIRAAVILSGASLPGGGRFVFPRRSPPLLATQGSADTINPPTLTRAFFDLAPRPKFLLTLIGAAHLPPYTDEQPELGVVERVTIAFLARYLRTGGSLEKLVAVGSVHGVARLESVP
jgi:dienelactone hydrolase